MDYRSYLGLGLSYLEYQWLERNESFKAVVIEQKIGSKVRSRREWDRIK